jgi:OPA family glycerol-3-phosphate transporter-like MFS transporter
LGLILVSITLMAVIGLYFRFNPLAHGQWFMFRRFVNWFPLGLSYAFLYMGRNNLNVTQDAMTDLMPSQSFGTIFAVGAIVYAISLIVNGPIVDKIGGKKGILIATLGAAAANACLGLATYLLINGKLPFNMTLVFSILYAINMYFQSYGAVSIIKVKAYWFHVRERGVFGAIFGALISLGVYLAFDWGRAIVVASKAKVDQPNFLQELFQSLFHVRNGSHDAIWLAYFIPAGLLIFFALLDLWLIQDTPRLAGLEDFDTHDASSGEMHIEFSMKDLLVRVFSSPVLMLVGFIELTNGVVRNGIVNWYFPFLKQTNATGAEFFHDNWGLLLFLGGISGGFVAGYVSDKVFHSRRGPPVLISGAAILVLLGLMSVMLFNSAVGVGLCAVLIGFFTIAIHSLMSGTAGADFGGRKATATAAGVTDGFVYLGAGIQSLALGQLTSLSWQIWPLFLIPFSIIGIYLSRRMWRALPEATKRYLLVVEKISITTEKGTINSTVVEEITTSS